jgi:copper ion binding protein
MVLALGLPVCLAATKRSRSNVEKLRAILVLTVLLSTLSQAKPLLSAKPEETTLLSVEEMTCGHCVGRVERALKAVPGVVSVTVDLGAGTASVQGGGSCPSLFGQKMIMALEEAGYPARVITARDELEVRGAQGRHTAGAEGAEVGGGTLRLHEPGSEDGRVRTLMLRVDSMTCGKCKGRVERVLNALPGVKSAVVDLHAGTARVRGLEAGLSVSDLLAALLEAGYPARELGQIPPRTLNLNPQT